MYSALQGWRPKELPKPAACFRDIGVPMLVVGQGGSGRCVSLSLSLSLSLLFGAFGAFLLAHLDAP